MVPDFILLGDSHTIALEDAARQMELTPAALRFSGAAWHTGRFIHGDEGFVPRAIPAGMRALNRLRAEFGVADVLSIGAPILTTVGFHLGLLASPLGWHRHEIFTEGAAPKGPVLSQAFANAYMSHYRARHLRTLRRIARGARLVVIAPPVFTEAANSFALRDLIIAQMRAADLTVFDPLERLFGSAHRLLPAEMIAEDGRHANADYGVKVLQSLAAEGILA